MVTWTRLGPRLRKKQLVYAIGNIGVVAITFVWLLPMMWMFANSFRDPAEPFYMGIWPTSLTAQKYIEALTSKGILRALSNSLVVAGSAALIDVCLATLTSYGLVRFRFRGQNLLQVLLLVIRLFPIVLLAIAFFRVAGFFGVYDTHIPLIVVGALVNLPFAIWSMNTAFEALPLELEEASWMDGLTRIGGIVRILLPLMLPNLIATGALVFLLVWNEYLFAVSFIRSTEKHLVTVAIASNVALYHIDFMGLLATGMLASLPIILIFLLLQRHFISGLRAGALQG